jgi:hypothetical protein
MPLRCGAVIMSGYRVTFPVLARKSACVLLTLNRRCPHASVAVQQLLDEPQLAAWV